MQPLLLHQLVIQQLKARGPDVRLVDELERPEIQALEDPDGPAYVAGGSVPRRRLLSDGRI